MTAARLGRVAPCLARDEVGDAPVPIDQLHLRATLEFLAFGFQFAAGKMCVLRADQALALGNQRPHPQYAALHARLDDPHDARAFAVDRREHRGDFALLIVSVLQDARRWSRGRGRVDAVLFQLEERAANFTTQCPGCASFHLDEHRGSTSVLDPAKRACDCELRDSGVAFERAQFRDRIGGRGIGIEACLEQIRVVRIRVG